MGYIIHCFGETHVHNEYMEVEDGFIMIDDEKWLSDYTNKEWSYDVLIHTFNLDNPDNHIPTHNHIYVVSDEPLSYKEALDIEKRVMDKFFKTYPNLIRA